MRHQLTIRELWVDMRMARWAATCLVRHQLTIRELWVDMRMARWTATCLVRHQLTIRELWVDRMDRRGQNLLVGTMRLARLLRRMGRSMMESDLPCEA